MSSSGPKRPRHSIADHALGALLGHVHAPGEDHDHDHDHDHDGLEALLPDAGRDGVVLTSVGIDIGSSGTQLAFARLALERTDVASTHTPGDGGSAADAARLEARRRRTIHQSPVFLTPFLPGDRIDEERLGSIVDQAFAGAGLTADDIDCGVVVLTGAARERTNAEAIARRLSEACGDIVSASAGHHLEARLAAHGSGAVQRSADHAVRFLNVDIGGATTKLAVCEGGRVIATAALAIGGRLVATDTADRIERLDPSGAAHARRAGITWTAGGPAPFAERQVVGAAMAELLVGALCGSLSPAVACELWLTDPLPLDEIGGVMFSGGVGEYVYGRERRSFGDLGLPLGRAIARLIDGGAVPWPLMPAAECIRATVLGASSWSVQLSGRTGFISDPATLLPRRNLPVVRPALALGDAIEADEVARKVADALDEADAWEGDVVLALAWEGLPEHARLRALADGVKRGFTSRLDAGRSLIIVVDGDIAGSLGMLLRDELGIAGGLMVLDGIELQDLDFVDLGRLRLPSETVPVTIKTLVFREESGHIPRASRRRGGRR